MKTPVVCSAAGCWCLKLQHHPSGRNRGSGPNSPSGQPVPVSIIAPTIGSEQCSITPFNILSRYNPHLHRAQAELMAMCKRLGIVFNGYSPLGVPDDHVFPPVTHTCLFTDKAHHRQMFPRSMRDCHVLVLGSRHADVAGRASGARNCSKAQEDRCTGRHHF